MVRELTEPPHLYPFSVQRWGKGGTDQELEKVQELGALSPAKGSKAIPASDSRAGSLDLCWRCKHVVAFWEDSHHPDDQELASMAKSSSLWPAGFHQHVHLHTIHANREAQEPASAFGF